MIAPIWDLAKGRSWQDVELHPADGVAFELQSNPLLSEILRLPLSL